MKYEIFHVNAFATQPFTGNPAAVVPLPEWLDDAVLQAIAAQNNLSETAFFVPAREGFELRWFTPRAEIDLCGHATLASAFVLFNFLGFTGEEVRFFSRRSGTLTVRREGARLSLDFPARPHTPVPPNEDLSRALGATPILLQDGRDFVAFFETEADIRALRPDASALEKVAKHGVIVSAPGDNCDFVVRAFFPALGIPEDPVTGTAYTVLAPHYAVITGKSNFRARQLSARGGDVEVTLLGDRVRITGEARLYLRGTIEIREIF